MQKSFLEAYNTIHKCNIIYTRETYCNSCLKIDDDSLQINKYESIRLEQRPSAKGDVCKILQRLISCENYKNFITSKF